MDTSKFTARRPNKGGMSLEEKARAYSVNRTTLAQEADRLQALARANAEANREHTCPKCLERYFRLEPKPGEPPSGKILCGCNKPLPPEQEYARKVSACGIRGALPRFDGIMSSPSRVEALSHARAMVERGGGWLTLWGPPGNGKTTLAYAAANEAMYRGKHALYVMFGLFLENMRAAYDGDGESVGAMYKKALEVDFLIVDELDAFKLTEWAIDRLRMLYHARYNAASDKCTIWLTNATPKPGSEPEGCEWLRPLYSRISEWPCVKMADGDVRPAIGAARQRR